MSWVEGDEREGSVTLGVAGEALEEEDETLSALRLAKYPLSTERLLARALRDSGLKRVILLYLRILRLVSL